MFRSAALRLSALTLSVLCCQIASAGDLMSIVFEDSAVMSKGENGPL